MNAVKNYLSLMRVKHYVKNVLVFIPLLFSRQLFQPGLFLRAFLGFLSFSMASSAVYIINDIHDLEKDRCHPVKCKRPLASGAINRKQAILAAAVCIAASLGISFAAGKWQGMLYILVYLAINVAYSRGLKDVPLIDVAILAMGYLLRVMYGARITEITISGWLYLTVFSGAFYMGLGKRRNELKNQGESGETRAVLKNYTYGFLDRNMYVCLTLTDTFYALWAMSRENRYLIWTVPVVMLILMRYSLDVEGSSDGDPVEVILHDRILLVLAGIYGLSIFLIVYLAMQ